MRNHAWPQAAPPDREQPEQDAEKSDSCRCAYPFVEVANAEYKGLQKDGQGGAAGDSPKLFLKIAAKSEFFTKSGGKGERNPHQALKNSLGKKSLRGIRSAAEEMRILQTDPQRPERSAECEVGYNVCWSGPSAANQITQTNPALVHAPADIEHQEPFRNKHGNVTRHGAIARRCRLWMLPCGALEETTGDGKSHKNSYEHNGMPYRGDKRAAG